VNGQYFYRAELDMMLGRVETAAHRQTLNAATRTVNGKPAIGQMHSQMLAPFSYGRW